MWSSSAQQEHQPRMYQQLALDEVWVVPGEIRKSFLQDELNWTRLETNAYLNWYVSGPLKRNAKVMLANGYVCNAPASLLAAFSSVLCKLIMAQVYQNSSSLKGKYITDEHYKQQQQPSNKELVIHLNDMPNLSNAGLYNVICFIQNGQIKFLETELENILSAANDLDVTGLVCLICEEMVSRIKEKSSTAIPLLYVAVACLPPSVSFFLQLHFLSTNIFNNCSQYRNIVIDAVAMKFDEILIHSEFKKLSFEMLYALTSAPKLQEPEWVIETYGAIIYWLRNNMDQFYAASSLLDNVNFKAINIARHRQEIMRRAVEIPDLKPTVQIFLMDSLYAQFSECLADVSSEKSNLMPSSAYTISNAETVNLPSSLRGTKRMVVSSVGSFNIPQLDSIFSRTESTDSSTPQSLDRKWYPERILQSSDTSSYQSEKKDTSGVATTAAATEVKTNLSDSGKVVRSHLTTGPDQISSHGSPMESVQSVMPSLNGQNAQKQEIIPSAVEFKSAQDSYLSAASSQQGPSSIQKLNATQKSRSNESATSSRPRRKFEQIPLRTEPPKSHKELRKERQARERASKM
ncbi:unnamed protein product [Thelazia callipaeda]|uniref:BACK domain-containing protein n=1 Tax=Thelazia callipaeda TaxID=103827 RepID=A0A0N5D0E4_THECL|nr:unnamed protein product [Thelazia callipaeda]